MKKSILIGIIFAMLITMSMTVFAAENGVDTVKNKDSINISQEERQLLGAKDSEKVIRIYNVSIRNAFANVKSIDELLKSEGLILSQYYLVQAVDNTYIYKDIIDNVSIDLGNDVPIDSRAMKALQENKVIAKVSSEIEIYETYYLTGETTYTGSAIYYKTNKGDYVYYSYYAVGSGEYLFPIKDFCEYQKAIQSEIAKYPNSDGGVDISQLWDLSKYDIHSANFKIATDTNSPTDVENQQSKPYVEDLQSQQNVKDDSQPDGLKNSAKWVFTFAGVVLLISASVFIGIGLNRGKRKNQQG